MASAAWMWLGAAVGGGLIGLRLCRIGPQSTATGLEREAVAGLIAALESYSRVNGLSPSEQKRLSSLRESFNTPGR